MPPTAGPDLIGALGSVTTPLRGGDRPGDVRVVVEGLPHYYLAYCAQPLPAGNPVLVINVRGGRQIDVEPWNELGRHVADVPGTTEGK